ncbi:MAG: ABC transporter substrate-binding protein, partial [Myxococcota bacterium]|nr:ABC transporter substrate-binding protein [Myxococcota bacterium]
MSPRSLIATFLLAGSLTASATAFRYAEDQAPAIVNPVFTTTMSEARLNELLFERLFTDNQDLATQPQLAERFEVDADRKGMTIWLRQDVQWHDGTALTARDVVFTIEAMQDRGTLSTEAGKVSWIRRALAVSDYEVELTFEKPEGRPQDKLFFKILPSHMFDETTLKRSDPFRNRPVGSGPYRLTRFNDDNSISLERYRGYRGQVGMDEIVMREVSDKNYQARLLTYESLEALVRVLPRDLAVLQNNRMVELYPYQTNSWWYLGFNHAQPPFDNVDIRRALAGLIDVETLLAPVGTGEVLSGPFVKSSPFYNHEVAPHGHTPMDSEALLTAAGYEYDGLSWTLDGKPLSVTITAHKSLEASQEVVINLQSQLQRQGIEVDVDFLDDVS